MEVCHNVLLDSVAKNINNVVKLLFTIGHVVKWTGWKQLKFINDHYITGKNGKTEILTYCMYWKHCKEM